MTSLYFGQTFEEHMSHLASVLERPLLATCHISVRNNDRSTAHNRLAYSSQCTGIAAIFGFSKLLLTVSIKDLPSHYKALQSVVDLSNGLSSVKLLLPSSNCFYVLVPYCPSQTSHYLTQFMGMVLRE